MTLHFQLDTPDEIPAGDAVAAPALRSTSTTSLNNGNDAPPPAQISFTMTGHPKAYVDAQRALHPPSGPLVDNVHRTFGGKRGQPAVGDDVLRNVLERGNRRAHFHEPRDLHVPVSSVHSHAVKVDTNARGEAVAVLMPSFMGGDRFKLRVFLDPLRGRPSDGRAFPAVFAETGTLVVWRIFRISKYLRWDYPAGTTPQQRARCFGNLDPIDTNAIKAAYERAWLDVELEPDATAPTPISAAEHRAAIRYAKANASPTTTQRYDLGALVLETGASAGVIELRTAAQYDAAPKSNPPPPGGWLSAQADPSYWQNIGAIFHALKTEFVHYFTKNAISGHTILQAPAVCNFTPSPPPGRPLTPFGNSGWGTDRRACWVVFGHAAYHGWMPYDQTANALHETGHVAYGVHQFTKTFQVGVNGGGGHDGHDYTDLCIMGYMICDPDFCGRCVLNQAGWNTQPLTPNPPGP